MPGLHSEALSMTAGRRGRIYLAATMIVAAGTVAAAQTLRQDRQGQAVPPLVLALPASGVTLTQLAIQDGRLAVSGRTEEPNAAVKIDGRYYFVSDADGRFRSTFNRPSSCVV